MQPRNNLQELFRPPFRSYFEVGMTLYHGHFYVSYSRLSLMQLFILANRVFEMNWACWVLWKCKELGERQWRNMLLIITIRIFLHFFAGTKYLHLLFKLLDKINSTSDNWCLITLKIKVNYCLRERNFAGHTRKLSRDKTKQENEEEREMRDTLWT